MITHLAETTSTMFYQPETLPHIVMAEQQCDGEGRTGQWLSPRGNFYATFFFANFENALVVFTAVIAELLDLEIKWPNDLVLNGVKCGGLLVNSEASVTKVGVGINFVPTGEFEFLKEQHNFDTLAKTIFERTRDIDIAKAQEIYSQRSNVRELTYRNERIVDVNPECQLICEGGDVLVHVTSAKELEK